MKEIQELKKYFLEKMEEFGYDTYYDYQEDVENLIDEVLSKSYNLHR